MTTRNTAPPKIYSERAILLGTFFGGPIVTGILMSRNFQIFQQPQKSKNAVFFGVLVTVGVLASIFLLPDAINDKIPNVLFPIVYTALAYYFIHKFQKTDIEKHENSKQPFYSLFRALGIGVGVSIVFIGLALAYFSFVDSSQEMYDAYDEQINIFSENEEAALQVLSNASRSPNDVVVRKLITVSIPEWEQNITLMQSVLADPNYPEDVKQHALLIQEYSELRLEEAQILKRIYTENTSDYDAELAEISAKIDRVLAKLE